MSAAVLLLALVPLQDPTGPARPVLKDGDRALLLGSALIEHEQFFGYLETRLVRHFPEASITFRNLGWSGDTVRGTARTSGLHNPEGFARLLKELRDQKPTVILLGYGTNESFDGPASLPGFLKDYETLLDELAKLRAQVVVLSPAFHEDLGRPFPNPAEHNKILEQYTAALEKLSARRKLLFVDLFHTLRKAKESDPKRRLTTNGLLPSALGYWHIALQIERQLCGEHGTWRVELDRSGKVLAARGAHVREVKAAGTGLSLDVLPSVLPAPVPPGGPVSDVPQIRIAGLAAGKHALRIAGRGIVRAAANQWDRGICLRNDPAAPQTDRLRAAIVRRNGLFYRRWRPFNDFAEHWGYIGGDLQLYEKLIVAEEARIAGLRRPGPIPLEVVPADAEAKR